MLCFDFFGGLLRRVVNDSRFTVPFWVPQQEVKRNQTDNFVRAVLREEKYQSRNARGVEPEEEGELRLRPNPKGGDRAPNATQPEREFRLITLPRKGTDP